MITVGRTCLTCGGGFELTPQQMNSPAPRKYCSVLCRRKAQWARKAQTLGPCRACGKEPARGRPARGLILCEWCHRTAFLSCWRKVGHPTAEIAAHAAYGETLRAYLCLLCGCWHSTHKDEVEDPSSWEGRRADIARYMREAGFDLAAWRDSRRAGLTSL